MKSLSNKLFESIKTEDEGILQMLEFFAKSFDGVQSAMYKQKAKDADSVEISSIYDVFSEEEIKEIKKRVNPKPKMCYENAYKLADRFEFDGNHEIRYVEGYLNMKGFPIEHAFNVVDGKYVDITIELGLGRDVKEDTYVKIGEFDVDEVRTILLQNQFYGQIYETIFLNKYKENVKV